MLMTASTRSRCLINVIVYQDRIGGLDQAAIVLSGLAHAADREDLDAAANAGLVLIACQQALN